MKYIMHCGLVAILIKTFTFASQKFGYIVILSMYFQHSAKIHRARQYYWMVLNYRTKRNTCLNSFSKVLRYTERDMQKPFSLIQNVSFKDVQQRQRSNAKINSMLKKVPLINILFEIGFNIPPFVWDIQVFVLTKPLLQNSSLSERTENNEEDAEPSTNISDCEIREHPPVPEKDKKTECRKSEGDAHKRVPKVLTRVTLSTGNITESPQEASTRVKGFNIISAMHSSGTELALERKAVSGNPMRLRSSVCKRLTSDCIVEVERSSGDIGILSGLPPNQTRVVCGNWLSLTSFLNNISLINVPFFGNTGEIIEKDLQAFITNDGTFKKDCNYIITDTLLQSNTYPFNVHMCKAFMNDENNHSEMTIMILSIPKEKIVRVIPKIQKELLLTKKCSHLSSVHGIVTEGNYLSIIREHPAGGTLHDVVKGGADWALSAQDKIIVFTELLRAIECLNHFKIFLTEIEVGFAFRRENEPRALCISQYLPVLDTKEHIGYSAPESLSAGSVSYTEKQDSWLIGCFAYFLMTGLYLEEVLQREATSSENGHIRATCYNDEYLGKMTEIPEKLKEILRGRHFDPLEDILTYSIRKTIIISPDKRSSASELLKDISKRQS